MAIVGMVNHIVDSTMETIGYLSKQDVESLRDAEAAGDINSVFFDKNGVSLDHHINDSVIGVDMEGLRHIDETIAIAHGKTKFQASTPDCLAAPSTYSSPMTRLHGKSSI